MNKVYYLNLTNGLEFCSLYPNHKYVRIQSTYCEGKFWQRIIQDLDYDFLLNIVSGKKVIVVDASGKKNIPRSLYQGIPWIEYVLSRRWLHKVIKSKVKGIPCGEYFEEQYKNLSRPTKKKLDYVKKFLNSNLSEIKIKCISYSTKHDGDYSFYKKHFQRRHLLDI